jgi:hypothetical protein
MILHAQVALEPHELHILFHRPAGFVRRQRSLQKRTSFHTFSHFFRHTNGRPQTTHVLEGRSCFFTPRIPYALRAGRQCRCSGDFFGTHVDPG